MTIHVNKHIEHTTTHLLPIIAKGLVAGYDWLAGPAMSEQERMTHELAETESLRRIGNMIV